MPSTVYIMRHGPAESGAGKADEARTLTPEGARGIVLTGKGLKALNVEVDAIIASPLIRAVQTAEAMRDALAPDMVLGSLEELGPGYGPAPVVEALQGMTERTVMLVGHLPDLATLTALLILGQPAGGIGFQPGSIARIDFQGSLRPGMGILRWLLSPEQVQALGG